MENQIDKVYNKFLSDIRANPSLERELQISLQKANHNIQMHFIQRHEEGYCAKFAIPDKDLNNIFINFPSISDDELKDAFIRGWNLPRDAECRMHSNIYYHRMMLIILYGAKNNKKSLAEYATRLILFRIWNGRILRLIHYCNPEIMAAVVSASSQRLIKKHHNPLDLIQNYFAPTIYSKYIPYMLRNSSETKRYYEQCYLRIKQIFSQNRVVDLRSGEKKYSKGLQPEYYEAHRNRNKITRATQDDNNNKDLINQSATFVETVLTFISVRQITYDPVFIRKTSTKIKGLRPSSIPEILTKIHQLKYVDILREILELYFIRIRGISEKDLCTDAFFNLVEKNIISSKNTRDVEFIKILCDKLLDSIFKNDMAKPYNDYMTLSSNARAPYKNIIIYGIGYNIQRSLCEYK